MEDEHYMSTPAPISDDLTPKRPSPYDMLMRQSRKMGGLATRTMDLTKEFLKQDVNSLRFENMSQRHQNTSSQDEASETKQNQGRSKQQPSVYTSTDTERSYAAHNGQRETLTLDPRDNLRKIVRKSHQVLAGARSVLLPVNPFPDSIIVDRTKVTITKRDFFWSSNVISVRIEDVLNVSTNTGPFFGSITLSSRVMNSTDHYEVSYLWRKDAIYLKQLIQGYVIAQHNQIETSHLERDELIKTLLELGQDSDF